MKKAVLAVTCICLIIVGGIAVAGFWDKQQSEKNVKETSSTSSYSQSTGINNNVPATNTNNTDKKSYTLAEVSRHSNKSDCWLAINGNVYNVTSYISDHPGGAFEILDSCGTDATTAFKTMNKGRSNTHSSSANSLLQDYIIGTVTK
jgi:cytochrome b involved in lipid metabolism